MSTTPKKYQKEKNELQTRFSISLSELTNTYPKAKTYPNITNIQKEYRSDSRNFNKVQADLFLLQDHIQQDIQNVSNEIERINQKLIPIEKENAKLKLQLSSLNNQRLGAQGLFQDTRKFYNQTFFENILRGLVCIGLIGYIIQDIRKT